MIARFLLLFAVLSSGSTLLSAQPRLSAGLGAGFHLNNRVITHHRSDLYLNYRNDNERYQPGTDLQVLLHYRLIPRLSLETGLSFYRRGYLIAEDHLIDPCYSPVTCGYRSELFRYRWDFLSVPLRLVYRTPGKVQFVTTAGFSLLTPVSRKVDWVLRRETGQTADQKVITREQAGDAARLQLSLDLGAGLGFSFWEKGLLVLQPELRYHLTTAENTDIRDGQYSISRFIGEDKTTRERLIAYGLSLRVLWALAD